MSEYTYITDPQEIFAAYKRGEKIEHTSNGVTWEPWSGMAWYEGWQFRIVKPEPKMEEVKLLGFLSSSGILMHAPTKGHPAWRRVPSEDKTVMVEVKE